MHAFARKSLVKVLGGCLLPGPEGWYAVTAANHPQWWYFAIACGAKMNSYFHKSVLDGDRFTRSSRELVSWSVNSHASHVNLKTKIEMLGGPRALS